MNSPPLPPEPGASTFSNSQRAIGKSKAELRPMKQDARAEPDGPTFPVYPDLENRLATASHPDEVARHVCSVLAGWAYSDAQTVADMMTRLGLAESRCRAFSASNNSMFIRSTAYLVQSKSGRVALLAYRGTDPFDLSTWAADYDVNPTAIKVPLGAGSGVREGSVIHGGFYRNQRSTWFDIAAGLKNALDNKSILDPLDPPGAQTQGTLQPLEALYITGHSLGAAMAGVAAFRIATDPQYKKTIWPLVRAVYSFAQPMIGNQALKESCESIDGFIKKYFVHVYENDVVPHLPPLITGGFVHFGTLFRSSLSGPEKRTNRTYQWKVSTEPVLPLKSVAELVAAVVALVAKQIVKPGEVSTPPTGLDRFWPTKAWLRVAAEQATDLLIERLLGAVPIEYSFYDHSATNYIACSQPPNVLTEFGDF
jgi:Lipase (class 3)